MINKDILELKKRYKKGECTFTKVCGCYVDSEKKSVFEFKETFLNLPDDELFKYLEIAKKSLSGKIGNNLLELNFQMDDNEENEKQQLFMMLKKSALKEDSLLSIFYQSIIDSYEIEGNYLILLYHDVYDVMTKTSDNRKLDESEEIYEYFICSICPVSLSKAGLGYFDEEQKIKSRIRDWVVDAPVTAFTFPGFIDRGSDVDTVMYYTKNAKNPHAELMESALGCGPKQTATIQMETFESIVRSTIISEDENTDKLFIDIQENLNTMVEEHNEIYDDGDGDHEPITLTKEKVKTILIKSGVSEEATAKIETTYEEEFSEAAPLAENLIDTKLLKKNAQKKKEEKLLTQIEALESKLEEVEQTIVVDDLDEDILDDSPADDASEDSEENKALENDDQSKNYDVVLHVKPEKLSKIKTQVIDGQRCLIVPLNDDEQTTINGIEEML